MNTEPLSPVSRRHFLQTGGSLTVGILAGMPRQASAAPTANIIEMKFISWQPEFYHQSPTLARRANGELWVTWSGGHQAMQVCPFGRVESMTSHDDGKTWSWPRVLLDSAIDDRDSGVMETAKGTLIVTTFTSLFYARMLEKGEAWSELTNKGWVSKPLSPEQLAKWKAAHSRLNDAERKADEGQWLIRSTDGGLTWSTRLPTIVSSPHGPIQLRDGRLLHAGKQLWTNDKKVGVCESLDDGQTWRWLADFPTRSGDTVKHGYHEPHAVEASDGTIIVHIRNHTKKDTRWLLQTESKDGGKRWSEPHPICFGEPSHLLKLRDGRLLMSYGYRHMPAGVQARLSTDNGKTWSEEIVIANDGIGATLDVDLGYPSTVELGDGSLLTVWYQTMKGAKFPGLRQSRWTLGA